ncbi:MAG: DMT family transporter [Alphaproteobacteria bacterium]|nr:DMT family transporter [Alphaproteobacteria bacterium]
MSAVLPRSASGPAVGRSAGAETARGIAFMVLSVALFATMDALVKWLGPHYPTMQLVFFRSVFAFVPIAAMLWWSARRHGTGLATMLRVSNPVGHVLRAAVGLASIYCFFQAFTLMPIADVVAISFAAPLFITALSVPLLGEKVGWRRWSAVLVGFAGVLIMVSPTSGVIQPAALFALGAALFYSVAIIVVRWLSRTDGSAAIVFYFTLAATLVSAACLPFSWVPPRSEDLLLLCAIGLVGGCAQICLTIAFRAAPVAVVAPFEYTAMLWAVGLGWVIWAEVPQDNIWTGAAIVVASGLFILFREAELGLPRGIARRLQTRR